MTFEDKTGRTGIWAQRPDPTTSILLDIALTGRLLRAAFERRVGIPQGRLHFLVPLSLAEEVGQAELQRDLGVDGAHITRQLKQLEAEGLLTRRPDPADNRFTLVSLTASGRRMVTEVLANRRALEAEATAGIGADEIECFHRVLARLRDNVCGVRECDEGAGVPGHPAQSPGLQR